MYKWLPWQPDPGVSRVEEKLGLKGVESDIVKKRTLSNLTTDP